MLKRSYLRRAQSYNSASNKHSHLRKLRNQPSTVLILHSLMTELPPVLARTRSRACSLCGLGRLPVHGHEQVVGLVHLACEVGAVGEQLLEVHCTLIEKHARDSGGNFLAVSLSDQPEDVVSNEVVLVSRLHAAQSRDIDLGKSELDSGSLLLALRPLLLLLVAASGLAAASLAHVSSTLALSLATSGLVRLVLSVTSSVVGGPRLLHMLLLLHFVPKN